MSNQKRPLSMLLPQVVGLSLGQIRRLETRVLVPVAVATAAFAVLFFDAILTLLQDWWTDPDASHGLLLAPLAIVIGFRRGLLTDRKPQPALGISILVAAVLLRYVSGLAAEMFSLRMSLVGAAMGLVVFIAGLRQLAHWWLPAALITLSVPIPAVLLNSLALPLQLKASAMGAVLLEWRDVPTLLAGNVIHVPGQSLFVTEACSGLRSITALLSIGVLIGGLWLRSGWSRGALIAATIPVAMTLNGIRVFLTGFLVFYLDPSLGEGFMHYTEGWVLFVVAFGCLGATAWIFAHMERRVSRSHA